MNNNCPSCAKEAMSYSRRLFGFRPLKCQECGVKLKLAILPTLACSTITLVLILATGPHMLNLIPSIPAFAVGILVVMPVLLLFVPFSVR
jgi:hypothetical protein